MQYWNFYIVMIESYTNYTISFDTIRFFRKVYTILENKKLILLQFVLQI